MKEQGFEVSLQNCNNATNFPPNMVFQDSLTHLQAKGILKDFCGLRDFHYNHPGMVRWLGSPSSSTQKSKLRGLPAPTCALASSDLFETYYCFATRQDNSAHRTRVWSLSLQSSSKLLLVFGCLPIIFEMISTGTGNTIVLFFSAEMLFRVCRQRSCKNRFDEQSRPQDWSKKEFGLNEGHIFVLVT